MSWLSRARRSTRWSRTDWALLAEAWFNLLWAWQALHRWPLLDVLDHLERVARPPASSQAMTPDAGAVVRAVLRATHLYPMPMLCLPQSIATARMLAKRGQPCEVVIGAQPRVAQLDAHAWVEQDGRPVNSPLDSAETHPVLLRHPIGWKALQS
jgi:hypothetical protein